MCTGLIVGNGCKITISHPSLAKSSGFSPGCTLRKRGSVVFPVEVLEIRRAFIQWILTIVFADHALDFLRNGSFEQGLVQDNADDQKDPNQATDDEDGGEKS